MSEAVRLQLSKYLRTFRVGEERRVAHLLTGRTARVDTVMERVLRACEAGARTGEALATALPDADPVQRSRRWTTLLAIGALVEDPEAERAQLLSPPLPPRPFVDQIELTNHCPMSCAMCPKGRGEVRREAGFMDEALFARLVEQLVDGPLPRPVPLYLAGESLLHPRVAGFVARAERAGVRTELSVNPALLTAAMYEALCEAGLSRLIVALDGLDERTLEAVRGKAVRAREAFANLEALLALRRADPQRGPELVVQMVRTAQNLHQAEAFQARYADLGLPRARAWLKDLDATTPPEPGRPEVVRARPYLCRAPWSSVVVLWDGRVVPCCYDHDARLVLGDLRRQSLDEIWRGEPLRGLREALRAGPPAGHLCESCANRPDRYRRPPLDDYPEEPLQW